MKIKKSYWSAIKINAVSGGFIYSLHGIYDDFSYRRE